MGEFGDFIKPIFDTLDLYHNQGVDPRAIAISFKQLAENHPHAELEIVAMEKRGQDKFLLRAKTAATADKSELSAEYFATGEVIIDPPVESGRKRIKYTPTNVEVSILAERVQYYGKDGKLITESIKDYTRKTVRQEFNSLDNFLKRWSAAEQKQAIIQELNERGILLEALADEVGQDFDPFDLICHVVFDQPPLNRRDRAQKVRQADYFAKYSEPVRAVLNALLDKYADEGIENIEDISVLKVQPISLLGTPMEIIKLFGNKQKYLAALQDLKTQLYMAS